MTNARMRDDEVESLAALAALEVLDSAPEAVFESLVRAASLVCEVPISLVSLIDVNRQWFKANLGLPGVHETPREVSFCAHAVLNHEIFEISDARLDTRFAENPLVLNAPYIRFYAGVPLTLQSGHNIGTLCVIDRVPKTLTAKQREVLQALAKAAAHALEGRRALQIVIETTGEIARREQERREQHERLQRSEDFLARTGRVAGVGGWHFEVDSNAIHWTDETCRIHGIPAGRHPTRTETDSFYVGNAKLVIDNAVKTCLETGQGWDLEVQMVRADGRHVWVRSAGSAEYQNGRVVRLIGAVQDITARVHEHIALKFANERIALATDSGAIGIWEFNLVTRKVIWDDWMFRIYGIERGNEPVTYESWQQLVPKESRALLHKVVADLAAGASTSGEIEFEIVRTDGAQRHLASAARLTQDAEGRPARLIGATWDITESHLVARELRKQNAINALQANIAVVANQNLTLRETLERTINSVCSHLGSPVGHAFLHSPEDPALLVSSDIWSRDVAHQFGAFRDESNATTFHAGKGLVGAALRDRLTVSSTDLQAETFVRRKSAGVCGLSWGVAAPVLVGEEVVAVLEFFGTASTPYEPSFSEVASYAGVQVGRVVDRLRARATLERNAEALREQSQVDELTGLYNRRGFLELAEERRRAAIRGGQRVFLLFADLDGMKRINDELGHAQGDRAICEAGHLLRRTLRAADIVARLGGDEFVAFVGETGIFDASALTRRLHAEVARLNEEKRLPFALGISFGVVEVDVPTESLATMLKRADEAMYRDKSTHRKSGETSKSVI